MANLYNQTEQLDTYIGSISTSYDYSANFISISLHTDNSAQIISGVAFTITINLRNGNDEQRILSTDSDGFLSFFYPLNQVLSIDAKGQLISPSNTSINIAHQVMIEHPISDSELLTISAYVDGYYLIIFGKLAEQLGDKISAATVDIVLTNYDLGERVTAISCVTNQQGEYSTKCLIGDGDWDLQAAATASSQLIAKSKTKNIVLRRDDQKFSVRVSTVEISSRYSGFAAYPSVLPAPSGELELLATNLWDDKSHYLGRIIRDNDRFYFGFYKQDSIADNELNLPIIFELDRDHSGYITGSTLIINDLEKYEMGSPNSYDDNCVYFDISNGDSKRFFDKYVASGKSPQTIKMAWIFRT